MTTKVAAVTVIGLGPMGGAIARTLLARGCAVTVWNRTAERAADIVAAGAKLANSPAEAIAASPLAIVVVASHRVAHSILASVEVCAAIGGRTLVQMTTGDPLDVKDLAQWAERNGAHYLEGGIMCYPRSLGADNTVILYAGDPEIYRQHADTLRFLAGAQRHIGSEIGVANAALMTAWNFFYAGYAAFIEGAALAKQLGVSITDFLALSEPLMPRLSESVRDVTRRLAENDLGGDQATIDALVEGMETAREVFLRNGIEPQFYDASLHYLRKAQNAGEGSNDFAATFSHVLKVRCREAPGEPDFFNVLSAQYKPMETEYFQESGAAEARVLYQSADRRHLTIASRYPNGVSFRYGGTVDHKEAFYVVRGEGMRTFSDGTSVEMVEGDLVYVRPGIDIDYVYGPGFLDVAFFWSDGRPLSASLTGGIARRGLSD